MIHVISDLHLGDGSENDEFQGADEDLRAFLKDVGDGELVLNGDIFELLKFEMDAIIRAHCDLILDLFAKVKIYIVGNHDREMLNHSFGEPAYLCRPIAQHAIIGDTLFMHGHQFDPFNDETHLMGDTITQTVGWISGVLGGGTNEQLRKLEDLVGNVGRDGDPAAYRIRGLNFLEHFVVEDKHLKRIVLAHTHSFESESSWNNRFYYYNAGSWIHGARDVVRI